MPSADAGGSSEKGSPNENGAPANGSCDFEFALFDAATAGTSVGAPLTLNAVGVSTGGVCPSTAGFWRSGAQRLLHLPLVIR
jgi:hypothetical protein